MQQLRKYLLKNIPADTSYFELYSGPNPSNLTLAVTNIIPDKFGFVRITFREYKRSEFIYYKWKIVDAFGNKSDFSDINVLELTDDRLFDQFILEQIGPDLKIIYTETGNPVLNSGESDTVGFFRYSAAIKKKNNQATRFSSPRVLYSNQDDGAVVHAAFIQVQPQKTYPGEKFRLFWRVEAGLDANIVPYPQLFSSSNPLSLNGIIEDKANGYSIGFHDFTIESNSSAGQKSSTTSLEIISPNPSFSVDFQTSNNEIFSGDSATLSWTLNEVAEAYIDNGISQITVPTDFIIVSPTETTTYTLIAHGDDGGVVERSLTIKVKQKPVINIFSSNITTLIKGNKAQLSWAISHANKVSIDQGVGEVFNSEQDAENILGNIEVAPNTTTTYTITAEDQAGEIITDTFTFTVVERPIIEEVFISPKNEKKVGGESIDITYSISNATSATIVGPDSLNNTLTLPNDTITINLLAAEAPVFERRVVFTIQAINSSASTEYSFPITIQTPKPILYTGIFENPDSSLTDIITDFTNINAIEIEFNYIFASNLEVSMTDISLLNPTLAQTNLTFDRAGVANTIITTIDFTPAINSVDYAAGQVVDFILKLNGPGGQITKNIIFDKNGVISVI